MKTYWGLGMAPLFLTLALDGDEWIASRSCLFTPKLKLSLCLIKQYTMKTYWGVGVWLHYS
jgi:hypothetical protein